jgi:predicted aspartyl protease
MRAGRKLAPALAALLLLVSSAAAAPAPTFVRLPLKLRYNVPAVPCTLNGSAVWMIVDTGSQVGLLAAETAARVGVHPLPGGTGSAQLTGSHGAERANVGMIDRLAVGAWSQADVPTVIRQRTAQRYSTDLLSPPVLIDVLSVQLLRRVCSYVTIDSSTVEFGFQQAFRPIDANRGAVPLRFRRGLPYADLVIKGRRFECLVDTGTSAPLELNARDAADTGLRAKAGGASRLRIGIGEGNRQAARVRTGILAQAQLGGASLRNVEAAIVPDSSKIGFGLLRHFRTTFDFQHDRLWLEPR